MSCSLTFDKTTSFFKFPLIEMRKLSFRTLSPFCNRCIPVSLSLLDPNCSAPDRTRSILHVCNLDLNLLHTKTLQTCHE